MPFTFSHPAIVLPLSRFPRWFCLTGLMIGSMIPDVEYFLRMKIYSSISHSGIGVLLFDLPVGLLIAFIFHNLIRNQLCNNLPLFLQRRLKPMTSFNWDRYFIQHWGVVICSIVLGTLSHLVWDSFTHQHGFFVERIPFLQYRPFDSIPVFKLAQHGSTLFGAGIILAFIMRLPKSELSLNAISYRYWLLVFTIIILVLVIRTLVEPSSMIYGNIIVSFITATFIALTITPLVLRLACCKTDSVKRVV